MRRAAPPSKGRLNGLALWLALCAWGCNEGYWLEPTFCDQWCAALRHPSDCAQGPASCVRDCELTKASGECFPLQERLLSCYEALDPDAFMCALPGSQVSFDDRQRVEKSACRSERDALFECEAPGFGQCLGLCRGYQEILTQGALGFPGSVAAPEGCLLLTQPCETVCWTAFQFTSDELARLRLPPGSQPPGLADAITSGEATGDGGLDRALDGGIAPDDPIAALFRPCFASSGS